MIFPKFANMETIDAVRARYDPLATLIKPHITLVFPFRSELRTNDIDGCLHTALKDARPFALRLQGISRHSDAYGHYLFLNIREGKDHIETLHRLLYAGILHEFKSGRPYVPHMTLGKLPTRESLNAAYHDVGRLDVLFWANIDTISVEVIGSNDESIIENEYKLI